MIDRSFLTRHERGVLVAALSHYRVLQHAKSTTAAKAPTRAQAGANEFVAADLIRQLTQ